MRLLIATIVGAMLMPAAAQAYLDGATASIILQGIIGFFAAWGIYSRRATDWVKNLFKRKKEPAE